MDSRTLIAEIKADGWRLIRVNGSHHHFTHPTKPGLVTIPHPKKELPIGTVKSNKKTGRDITLLRQRGKLCSTQ